MILKALKQIAESYKFAFLFCTLAFPLVMVVVFAEGLQHYAEYKLGMFSIGEGGSFGPAKQFIRLVFGAFKVASIMLLACILPLFFQRGMKMSEALRFEGGLANMLWRATIFSAVMIFLVFFGLPQILGAVVPGFTASKVILLSLCIFLALSIPFQNKINRWLAKFWGFSVPNREQNKAINRALFANGLPVQFAAIMPAMALHYWFGYLAMSMSGFKLYWLLGLDSILVGILAALMASAIYVLFRDAITGRVS